jgi:hypothetical protein
MVLDFKIPHPERFPAGLLERGVLSGVAGYVALDLGVPVPRPPTGLPLANCCSSPSSSSGPSQWFVTLFIACRLQVALRSCDVGRGQLAAPLHDARQLRLQGLALRPPGRDPLVAVGDRGVAEPGLPAPEQNILPMWRAPVLPHLVVSLILRFASSVCVQPDPGTLPPRS